MKRRRAHSLIELMAAIAAGTTIMAIALGLFHTLFQFDRNSRADAHHQAVLGRLDARFRADVHAAESLEADDASDGNSGGPWRFSREESRTVEYRLEPDGLHRIAATGDAEKARETYPLPEEAIVSILPRDDLAPGMVRLEILLGDVEARQQAGSPVRIDAVLARDFRFTPSGQ